jgi:hypothetical protein
MGRRVGAWLVAAAVTAALVVGGVAVAGRDRAPAVLPPLELDGAQASAAATPAATGPAPAGPATPARPSLMPDAPQPWPPVTYQLRGSLPDLPDRGRAWQLGTDLDGGRLAALTAALGLRGQRKQDQAGWTVGDRGGTLRVNRLPGLPWSFASVVTGTCAGGPWPATPAGRRGIQCADAVGPGSAHLVLPGRPIRPLPHPADLPGRDQAERIARELAAKAGLALDGATVKVLDGYAARVVTIAPAVGGLPTSGFSWTVAVGPKGRIQYAGGWLALPQPAGTYPLMTEAEGLKRLRERPAWWPPILRPNMADRAELRAAPCPPATRLPCTPRPLQKQTVTITGVRLGLQLAPGVARDSRPAEVAYLLPAYLFDLQGGWTDVHPVVAVQDRYLTNRQP